MKGSIGAAIFSLMSVISQSSEGANGRDFQATLGAGTGKSSSALVSEAGTSNFEGWVPSIEFGIEIPWNQRSGIFANGEYRFIDSTNSTSAVNFIEKAEGSSQAMKLGFFLSGWSIGAGLSQDSLNIRQVSVSSGAKETKLSGASSVVFFQYSMVTKPFGRLTFEAQHRSGKLDNVKLTDSAALMKLVLLFPL